MEIWYGKTIQKLSNNFFWLHWWWCLSVMVNFVRSAIFCCIFIITCYHVGPTLFWAKLCKYHGCRWQSTAHQQVIRVCKMPMFLSSYENITKNKHKIFASNWTHFNNLLTHLGNTALQSAYPVMCLVKHHSQLQPHIDGNVTQLTLPNYFEQI